MNIYFDTEFTSLVKNTTLISIGLINDNNISFYAEFTDYDKSLVNDWIQKNVIDKLDFSNIDIYEVNDLLSHIVDINIEDEFFTIKDKKNSIICKGNKQYIRKKLNEWLLSFNEDINFISDVCHYDMVLLIDLLSDNALDLPDYISPSCHDINQDISRYFNISEKEAFNKSREDIVNKSEESEKNKHNSLSDARIIKEIYEKINKEGLK